MTTTNPAPHAVTQPCNFTADIQPETASTPCTASRHGDAAAYRRGCRCDAARRAIAGYEKRRQLERLHGQRRTLPNVGALRRLHALRALGWPSRELARRIGVDERNMSRWPHRRWISSAHHDAVCRVYADLADHTGPDERARRHADRSGWLPPIWWDTDRIDDPTYNPLTLDFTHDLDTDPVVIDRLIAGEAVQATKAERVQAVARLHERGKSYREIAQRVRVSVRQVHRDLQDLGLVGVSPYSPSRFLSVVVSTVDSVTDDASHAGAA